MKYCTHCGNPINEEAVLCVKCGCMIKPVTQAHQPPNPHLLSQLASRMKTNGIIWFVIGAFQILLGIYWSWWTLIVGVLNIISGINDMNRSSQITNDPRGIVSEHESVAGPVVTLIYNLLIGGLIGVIGSIYYFVAIRGMVMENKVQFLELERSFTNTSAV